MGKTTTCKAYIGESMGIRRQYCKNSRLIAIEMQVSNRWHLLHLYPIVFLHLFSIDIDFSFAKPARFYPNLVATFSFWFGRNLVAFRQLFQFARGGCAAKVVKGCIFLQDNSSMLVNPVGGTLSSVLKNNFRNFFCCYLCLAHHQLNADFLRKLFFEHYLKWDHDTDRLHFKEPIEVSHHISRDICMLIQEDANHWSSGIWHEANHAEHIRL